MSLFLSMQWRSVESSVVWFTMFFKTFYVSQIKESHAGLNEMNDVNWTHFWINDLFYKHKTSVSGYDSHGIFPDEGLVHCWHENHLD